MTTVQTSKVSGKTDRQMPTPRKIKRPPSSYNVFFDHLRKGQILKDEFRSELEDKLEEESE